MRNLLLMMWFSLSITTFGQTVKKNLRYHHFKTFYIDLNNDNQTDTIILSSSLPDKESFNRISIAMSGAKKVMFKAKDQWANIQPEFLAANKNLLSSKNLFFQKTSLHTVLIMSGGTDGAGYGGEFSIINIENNNIKVVFDGSGDNNSGAINGDIEIPWKLIDLENNGRLCFIYSHYGEMYKSVKGGMIGTYHPFYVLPVANDYKYSEELSKTYNEKHYVYVNPNHHGNIEIFYPDNKKLKPVFWK